MRSISFPMLDGLDVSVMRLSACAPTWHNGAVTRHDVLPRDTSLLMYIRSGRWDYEVNGRVVQTVTPGDVLFLPVGCRYISRCTADPVSTAIGLDFHLMDESGEELSLGDAPQVLLHDGSDRYEPLFAQALRAYLRGSGGKLAGKSVVYRLLDALAAQLRHEARAVGPYSALLPAIELLERHPERPVPVGELASMCYLSESNFRRKFIACMGCAPVTYRNRLRVQKAEELLQSGLYTVESAAELLGFTDGAHLCKARAAYHIDKGGA